MPNDIETLRAHLFETLAALRDKENPMDIARARAVSDVAKEIIDTARVEIEFAKVTGADVESKFLAPTEEKLPDGITGRTVHRLR